MQNEKLQINLGAGQNKAEVILREVSEANELKVQAPLRVNIDGIITSVYEFLSKRITELDQINQKRCHIIVNREKIMIELVANENDFYLKQVISGTLQYNSKFLEFGINTGKVWSPTELGLFFKMNRAFFTTKEENMKLVTDLMNFKGTVNNQIERSAKESGDRTDNFTQIVNSNLPKSFNLVIPIFKGHKPENIEIETFAQIDGRDVHFTLISPGAQATMEQVRDIVIDEQLSLIREIAPDIAIIEV
jgi:hypothetical protein